MFKTSDVLKKKQSWTEKKSLLHVDPPFCSISSMKMSDRSCDVVMGTSDRCLRSQADVGTLEKVWENIRVLISKNDQIKVLFSGAAPLLVAHTKGQLIAPNPHGDHAPKPSRVYISVLFSPRFNRARLQHLQAPTETHTDRSRRLLVHHPLLLPPSFLFSNSITLFLCRPHLPEGGSTQALEDPPRLWRHGGKLLNTAFIVKTITGRQH